MLLVLEATRLNSMARVRVKTHEKKSNYRKDNSTFQKIKSLEYIGLAGLDNQAAERFFYSGWAVKLM